MANLRVAGNALWTQENESIVLCTERDGPFATGKDCFRIAGYTPEAEVELSRQTRSIQSKLNGDEFIKRAVMTPIWK